MKKTDNRCMRRCVCLSLFVLLLSTPAAAQEELDKDWLRFALRGSSFGPLYGASSVLEAAAETYQSRYGCEKAADQNPATAWVEGAPGAGIGERYWIGLEHLPEALGLINGYAKNRDLFEKNYRVRSFDIQVFAAVNLSGFAGQWDEYYDARAVSEVKTIEIADSMEPQRVALPFHRSSIMSGMDDFRSSEALRSLEFPQAREMGLDGSEDLPRSFLYIIRLEIRTVYPGSRWDDTCIAELWPDYGPVEEVRLSEDSQRVSIVDSADLRIPVFYDFDYLLTLAELSRDRSWALVLKEPAHPGSGRVSSEYGIIHLPTGREQTDRILGPKSDTLLPYAFGYEDGQTYIEFENLETGEEGRAICAIYK